MIRVTISAVEYGAKFDHIHFDPHSLRKPLKISMDPGRNAAKVDMILQLFNRAAELGQVSLYGNEPYDPETLPELIFPSICGVTRCTLIDKDAGVVSEGYSFCSDSDQFNKKKGRHISLGRAIRHLTSKA